MLLNRIELTGRQQIFIKMGRPMFGSSGYDIYAHPLQ